jgi:hypothetical protein
MGLFLSRGCPGGPIHFLAPQFLCSIWQPVSSSRPTRPKEPARAGAVKDGASAPPRGLVLDGSEHGGTLGVVGMTTSRGARVWCTNIRATSLYSVGLKTRTHDAVMRISSEAPRRRTHSDERHESHASGRDPATSNRHRRPITDRADRPENRQVFLSDLPFSVQDGGRRPPAPRHRARGAIRR